VIAVQAEVSDIVSVRADAIVNAANAELWMGSGVAGAIKAAGGLVVEEDAMRQGPIARGEAVITGAGRLTNCRHVIHAAAMGDAEWIPSPQSIHDATLNSLKRAAEHGLETIAFPALGTGVGGFPLEAATRQMAQAMHDFEAQQPDSSVRAVMFVLRDAASLEQFRKGLVSSRPIS
jgi:O-acetyl-ADP-ribose deacetylase (regulator of RNase III)